MADQNPIPYMIATVSIRFYLTFIFVGQTAITGTPNDFLDWAALYVLGIIPDFPTIVNIILFLLTDGTLIVWLTLLVKRILNPVAN